MLKYAKDKGSEGLVRDQSTGPANCKPRKGWARILLKGVVSEGKSADWIGLWCING